MATIQAREWVLIKRFTTISTSNCLRRGFLNRLLCARRGLKCLPDRELEHFGLVAPLGDTVSTLVVQGHAQAESEESQGGQPLHGHADRASDIAKTGEAVALRAYAV